MFSAFISELSRDASLEFRVEAVLALNEIDIAITGSYSNGESVKESVHYSVLNRDSLT